MKLYSFSRFADLATRSFLCAAAVLLLVLPDLLGQASQITPIGSTISVTNVDDGYSEVSITSVFPDGIDFGGATYTTIFIGTNGYITFGSGFNSYSPTGIAGWNIGYPLISGQFDDLNPGNGGDIYYSQNVGDDLVVVTWLQVFPYNMSTAYGTATDGTTFQIILRRPADYSNSNRSFQMEVRYIDIGWHASGNISGWPTAGWSTGNQTAYGEMPHSGTADFHLNESESNVSDPGVFRWDVIGGSVLGVPTVNQTTAANSIIGSSAVSGGNVSSNNGAAVTMRGVVWSTSSAPTLASHVGGGVSTDGGTGTGSFSSTMTGLTPQTTYYARAYATNSEGTGYGPQIEFLTTVDPEPKPEPVALFEEHWHTDTANTITWRIWNLDPGAILGANPEHNLASGDIPKGLAFEGVHLVGSFEDLGLYTFTIVSRSGINEVRNHFQVQVIPPVVTPLISGIWVNGNYHPMVIMEERSHGVAATTEIFSVNATLGEPLSMVFDWDYIKEDISFKVIRGELPTGLVLKKHDLNGFPSASIIGVPTEPGEFIFVVSVLDWRGRGYQWIRIVVE